MWDEEINKKIKDAADQYHPAYDDDAWNKMEQMLDEHLPLKKDGRRIIYFLLLITLLTGVIFFVIFRNEIIPSSKNSEKTLSKNNSESQHEHQNLSPVEDVAGLNPVTSGKYLVENLRDNNKLAKVTPIDAANPGTQKSDNPSAYDHVGISNKNTLPTSKRKDRPLVEGVAGNSNKKNNINETINQPEPSNPDIVSPPVADNTNRLQKADTTITRDEKESIQSNKIAEAENPRDVNGDIKHKKTKKKSFIKNFGIGLGIGPDISAVRLSRTGEITPTYGAQLSYSFSDRFTLRTGFYVARKIYSVGEDDYHVRPGNTGNYTYLESIDANCKVHEIPVTLSYNFGKVKNHHWFASAGLSSYLMKRESYVYFYNYPWGTSHWSKTITNQNKHYFSVLDISAGYEYSINKRFSILAEPYAKLPLQGIGLGKIKLNSAGVLFTVAVKPF